MENILKNYMCAFRLGLLSTFERTNIYDVYLKEKIPARCVMQNKAAFLNTKPGSRNLELYDNKPVS